MVWSKRPYRSKANVSEESKFRDSAQDARDMKCQKSEPRDENEGNREKERRKKMMKGRAKRSKQEVWGDKGR